MIVTDRKIKKVSFLVDSLKYTGGDRLLTQIINVFMDRNVEASIFSCTFDRDRFFELPENLKVHQFDIDWLLSYFGKYINLYYLFINFYLTLHFLFSSKADRSADLIVLHGSGFLRIPLLKLFGYKVAYYLHFPVTISDHVTDRKSLFGKIYYRLYQIYEEFCVSIADLVIANSNFTIETSRKYFARVDRRAKYDENYLHLLYPCANEKIVDTDCSTIEASFTGSADPLARIDSAFKQNRYIFTSVNRLVPEKNLKLAIESFKHLLDDIKQTSPQIDSDQIKCNNSANVCNSGNNDDTTENGNNDDIGESGISDLNQNGLSNDEKLPLLVIAGAVSDLKKKYYDGLLEYVDSLDLRDNVVFLTSISDSSLNYVFSRTNCLLYTPVEEHFGIVPLEAMLFNVPTIALNSGGPKETVLDNGTGLLCENDFHDYYLKMKRLFSDPQLTKKMGLDANQRYYSIFSYSNFEKRLASILNSRGLVI